MSAEIIQFISRPNLKRPAFEEAVTQSFDNFIYDCGLGGPPPQTPDEVPIVAAIIHILPKE